MRIALILLAFIGDEVQAVPTLLECTRALEPGVEIMSSNAVLSTSVTVSFERDGETVACGGEYIPGETLTVVLSSTPTREMFEVTGGVLSTDGCGAYTGSESDGTNEENFCIDLGFSRCPKQGSSSQEMVAPSDGSDITAKVGFANGFGTVSITETCTLVAANDDTVVDLVIATDDLSILEDAVVLAELATTLSGDGPFTVFAPNNEAFQNLPEGVLTTLLNDIPALTDVLLYHVVSGTVLSTDLMDDMVVSTLLTDATFTVDLSNGVSFVFDTGSASPVSVDNITSNGVVHIIDTVLIPPADAPTSSPTATPSFNGTIVDLALATDDLSTLVTAVGTAGLGGLDSLSGDGPFTLFAPTNAAFDALPDGVLDSLLADTAALTDVLLYHVVAGTVLSTDLMDGMVVSTLLTDATFTVDLSNGVSFVFDTGSASPVSVDNLASNGVVHIIDTVLIPPADTAPPTPSPTATPSFNGTIVDLAKATDNLSTLVTAVGTAGLADTLSGDGPFTVFAPTNAAFDALPDGLLDSLLADTAALTDVLLYHVVSGTVLSTDLMDDMVVSTLLTDATFTVDLSNGVSFVFDTGSASPVSVDNLASNGVVHIIDTVLIPPEEEPEPTDSTSWYKKGQPSKDCSWVAAFTKRCGVKGDDKVLASYACPIACGTTIEDSTSWYKNGDPSKDCAWVSVFTRRCGVKGVDRVLASEACVTTCASS